MSGDLLKRLNRESEMIKYTRKISLIRVFFDNKQFLLKSSTVCVMVLNISGVRRLKSKNNLLQEKIFIFLKIQTKYFSNKSEQKLNFLYLTFRFNDIEKYLVNPPTSLAKSKTAKWTENLKSIFAEFKEELQASSGSNLLVSDVRTTYTKAQNTCRQMGMNLGEKNDVQNLNKKLNFSYDSIKRKTSRSNWYD